MSNLKHNTPVVYRGRPCRIITTPPGKSTVYIVQYQDGRAVEADERELTAAGQRVALVTAGEEA